MMNDESIALPLESRVQAFMTHVFNRYRKLSTTCSINTAPVETKDCVRCCKDSYFGGKS